MRKIFLLILLVSISLALFAGCASAGNANGADSTGSANGSNTQRHLPGSETSAASEAPVVSESPTASEKPMSTDVPVVSLETAGALAGVDLRHYWPADLVPDLPEYKYGEITGFSPPGDMNNETLIRAGNTSTDDLDAYLQSLQAGGWKVEKTSNDWGGYATAAKDLYHVTFSLQQNTNVLISVVMSKKGSWPSFDQYPINAPVPQGFELIDVDVSFYPDDPDDQRVGALQFTCLNMDGDQARAYIQSLEDGGYFEPFTWKGKQYTCTTCEEYLNGDGDNMNFYFDLNLAD